jgi:hypothetical protein
MSDTPCTVNGWYWYCDVHDTHGNADSEAESWFVAAAHNEWHYVNENEPDPDDPDYDPDGEPIPHDEICDLVVIPRGKTANGDERSVFEAVFIDRNPDNVAAVTNIDGSTR